MNASYPVAVPSAGDCIWGRVYCGVATQDLQRLDKFEGQLYLRKWLTVHLDAEPLKTARVIRAAVYVLNPRYSQVVCERPWCPAEFEALHLRKFLSTCVP